MTAPFRLFGAQLSPYSVKVRSYLRFKGLEFEWLERTNARVEEFQRYAKLPLAPVLVDANENAVQDSTPMIEALEKEFAEPSAIPQDAALAFLSALLEDYADEWLNKAMFHYRWAYPENQDSAAKRMVEMLYEGTPAPDGAEDAVKTRMSGRLHHVGSSPETAPLIEGSFTRVVSLLENTLGGKKYLFGDRPCLADFGLAGQLAQLLSDPSPGAILRQTAPNLVAWIGRMENPKVEGDFTSFTLLRGALVDLLREEIAAAYLAWMSANARAVQNDASGVSVEIAGVDFVQKPQRYAAKAFTELKRKRAVIDEPELIALLEETGCDAYLASPATIASPEMAPDADAEVDGDEEGDGDED
ncbi:glutathione S-transferase family protein [Terricaulis sp.]|uniref:glutathione S-transferase family protein n=1 Tax=Terricaulis sp. TaxID=2768686 RepID=UPI003783D0B5